MASTPLTNPPGAPVDFSDIQGLVRFGYGYLKGACYLLLKISNPTLARGWLASLKPTTAQDAKPPPQDALQVALSSHGLHALGVPQEIIESFSPEFVAGMAAEESRSRRLGDTGANAPSNWAWGGSIVPDILLMLYGHPASLQDRRQRLENEFVNAGLQLLHCLSTSDLDGFEPFGFADGISQPELDWHRLRVPSGHQYSNLLALGEFLLGYSNEYGHYTDRPLVKPMHTHGPALFPAEDQPKKWDLGRNGTYLVFRQLTQDVRGFWRFLHQHANDDPHQRQKLAEAMVGRTMEGDPLIPLRPEPIAGVGPDSEDIRLNQFTYDSDPTGSRCPFGAHARRANPRTFDYPAGTTGFVSRLLRTFGFGQKSPRDDLMASSRFHRILRRGREYGTSLSPEEALGPAPPDESERGLHFICLNANIARQFEFTQNAWIMGTKFDGLTHESDPLVGNRDPIPGCPFTNTYSMPRNGSVRRRLTGIPSFVTVRGGGYFFLPGIRALHFLATIGS